MQCVKRGLAHVSILSAFVFAFALAWGSPIVSARPIPVRGDQQEQPQKPDQNQSKSSTFNGTIVKDGGQYVLRDSSGASYTLDDTERAKPFEGKQVKVTGKLDEQSKVIHVESIQGSEG